ncbi:ATP-dependent Clp protease ATP-binding subunit [Candidatus Peribacteria bacterium]|nr:ATP-dependent Clp protease ATP-binding subunit [Candidatus Peribacteria bacterium]
MSAFNSFTETAKNTLILAQEIAQQSEHTTVQTHHLLLGILRQRQCIAAMVLKSFGVTYDNAERIAQTLQQSETLQLSSTDEPQVFSDHARACIEMSAQVAIDLGHPLVDSEHILFALCRQRNTGAVRVLQQLMVTPQHIIDRLKELFRSNADGDVMSQNGQIQGVFDPKQVQDFFTGLGQALRQMADMREVEEDEERPTRRESRSSGNGVRSKLALDYFCTDFTALAAEGQIEKVIGRSAEIERVVHILARKRKNNPMLVGEPGVGKTAIVEGLALQIQEGQVPDILMDKRILSLSLTNLVAGTKYRGEFEERIRRVIEEASDPKNDVILFIDEIHTIIGAGSAEGTLDAANILKPALARGDMQVIGATTHDEYQKRIETDNALARRFQMVDVPEPTLVEAKLILEGTVPYYERHHHVRISPEAVDAAVELSARYVADRYLPDKAFDLLDEACAAKSVLHKGSGEEVRRLRVKIGQLQRRREKAVQDQQYDLADKYHKEYQSLEEELLALKAEKSKGRKRYRIGRRDIAHVVHAQVGIPMSAMLEDDVSHLMQLEAQLQQHIIAQESAVEKIARAIRRSRIGLQHPNRPLGTFLFLGPTGVGKTEMARQLALQVYHDEKALITLDMSEFSSGHTASRLVGSTAGYVGYGDGGQLTEKIRRNPYSIVLFDEIEKAHREVHNMLLQILETGDLTDGKGRKVSFRNAIIILTSNVGASKFQQSADRIGFFDTKQDLAEETTAFDQIATEVQKELKEHFTAEFLNRLDATIIFRPLHKKAIEAITALQLREIISRLERHRSIMVAVPEQTITALAQLAYSPEYGARQVRRVLAERFEEPLVDGIITGTLEKNQHYTAVWDEAPGRIQFILTE